MRVRTHVMTGTAAALALAPWLRWLSVPLWLGASLADVDLYGYYVVRHRHLSLRRAVRYYNTLAGRRERARKLLHHPVVPIIALAGARRHPAIAAFGSGVALHLLLDAYGKRRFKRLRSVLEVRSGGRCEQCGARKTPPVLMEPRYVGSQSPRDTDPATWLMLCRPCNEAHHRAARTR